jgi:hypothetical protein
VSIGNQTFLALTVVEPLTPGHCLIVPVEHVKSTLELEDDAWTEMRNFMKCLMRMFHSQGKSCVFIETVSQGLQHAFIECIPLDQELKDDAPAYFKEAILAADEEWSQHRKVIDTRTRGFRHAMSSRMSYFHVWFTLDGGFGHVIEDARKFPPYFGKASYQWMT